MPSIGFPNWATMTTLPPNGLFDPMDRLTRARKTVTQKSSTLAELFNLLWQRKLWWMIPLVSMLVLVVAFLLFANAAGVVAPFLYTVF